MVAARKGGVNRNGKLTVSALWKFSPYRFSSVRANFFAKNFAKSGAGGFQGGWMVDRCTTSAIGWIGSISSAFNLLFGGSKHDKE